MYGIDVLLDPSDGDAPMDDETSESATLNLDNESQLLKLQLENEKFGKPSFLSSSADLAPASQIHR